MSSLPGECVIAPRPIVHSKYRKNCFRCGSTDLDDLHFFPVEISHGVFSTKFSCNECLCVYIPLPELEAVAA